MLLSEEVREAWYTKLYDIILDEWKIEESREAWYEQGRKEGREKILKLLKSGKSPEEIIKEYGSI